MHGLESSTVGILPKGKKEASIKKEIFRSGYEITAGPI